MINQFQLLYYKISSGLSLELLRLGGSSMTLLSLLLSVSFLLILWRCFRTCSKWFIRRFLFHTNLSHKIKREALFIWRALYIFVGAVAALNLSGLDKWITNQLLALQSESGKLFGLKLFTFGKAQLTLWSTIYIGILSWLLVRLTGEFHNWLLTKVLLKTKLERGVCETLASLVRYVLISLGFLIILQSAGIDLTALTVLAGALGIAIGLGLQSLLNNLVSGLVILFERPIKVGDRIDVGGAKGDVTHISLRATTIITNDDIAIIVPNSDFITSKVVNWTYTGRKCSFSFPIRVAYDSDPELVRKLLLEVASNHPGIIKEPPPKVLFDEFADNSLNFSLSVWTRDYVTRPNSLRSDLNYAISESFSKFGVKLPKPQTAVDYTRVKAIRRKRSSA